MDEIQRAYSQFVKGEIAENANPYPTGVQGFRAGAEYERERIIALLEAELYSCSKCDRDGASLIALIKGENE